MKMREGLFLPGLLALALLPWLAAPAQQPPPAADPARRLVVTFDGKLEDLPVLEPNEFQIETEKQKVTPKRVYNPDELPTVIAIVLQDNIRPEFGTQLPALRNFITSQPQKTYVGVFYLSYDSIDNPTNGFQANLKAVADLLRAPKGQADLAPPSPYTLITRIAAFMNNMPPARKEILFFSEGSDGTAPDSSPGQNRNLRVALEQARDAGIPVWVVYTDAFPPSSRVALRPADGVSGGRSTQLGDTQTPGSAPGSDPRAMSDASVGGRSTDVGAFGQRGDALGDSPTRPRVNFNTANLKELADKSGGKMLSSKEQLTDIGPFLEEFRRLLAQQLVLEFEEEGPIKKVRMTRKLKGVKLLAPER